MAPNKPQTPDISPPRDGWVDLHCHILPALDDGPEDLETAMGMVTTAAESGTRTLAATAHFPWNGHHRLDRYETVFRLLSDQIVAAGLPVWVVPSGDLRMTPELPDELARGDVPTINRSRYFLLEFDHHHVPSAAPVFVERVMRKGYIPIVTHPERNIAFQMRPNRLEPLVRAGALVQVTAASLTGRFGRAACRLSRLYLEHGFVHLLASDAHGRRDRTPDMRPGLRAAAQVVGPDGATRLGHDVPTRILRNEDVPVDPPARMRRRFRVGPWS